MDKDSAMQAYPVEQPVAGRSDGERFSADLEREDLASNDPGTGAPGAREEKDVNTPISISIGGAAR